MNGTRLKPATPRRLVVGMTGASGAMYGVRALELLRALEVESHFVMSRAGALTLAHETDLTPAAVAALADRRYPISDVGAAIASGAFRTLGMLIAPCSVRTMSEIASGVTTSLLTRAADVTLKERRPLVLMLRETPLHLGHLRSMTALAEMGAILFPPVPAWYARPATLDDLFQDAVGRAFDYFGLDVAGLPRWGETLGVDAPPDASEE